jgi:F-type H+-transporting ATPase subunit gamma
MPCAFVTAIFLIWGSLHLDADSAFSHEPIRPLENADEVEEQEVLFEPDVEELIGPLVQQYIQNQMYTAWLDTLAGEHAARMTAMDSATKNAGEMIKQLNLYYNRSRQAAITKELIEIISGAESL